MVDEQSLRPPLIRVVYGPLQVQEAAMIRTSKSKVPPILYLYLGMLVMMGGLISMRLTG
jgi:hypothetical protein